MLNEQDKEHARQIVQKALSKQFSPEFLNRLYEIITFDQLDLDAIKRIIDIELSGLYRRIGDKTVRVEWTMQDTSGWILGTVYLDDSEINLEMIEDGCAWYDRRTGPAPHYTAAEKKAREAKIGLWADPAAINPMNFRRASSARAR
jgi:hypothetical protein